MTFLASMRLRSIRTSRTRDNQCHDIEVNKYRGKTMLWMNITYR
jgi:hypothetical protein